MDPLPANLFTWKLMASAQSWLVSPTAGTVLLSTRLSNGKGEENSTHLQDAAVPFEQSQHRQQWWTDPGSAKMVTSEYLKNLVYYVKYNYE